MDDGLKVGSYEWWMVEADRQHDAHIANDMDVQGRMRALARPLVRGHTLDYWWHYMHILKRDGEYDEALNLAIECQAVAEYEPRWSDNYRTRYGWPKHIAIICMKTGRYELALEQMDKWMHAPGIPLPDCLEDAEKRIARLRTAIDRREAMMPAKRPDPMF
ncbi:hypothetical protein [Gryllotalpicola koreensis]|uniref:Tetratricopeptide repeat protein n=1 Tax=Gryllotalpicola koreensis TaxID=993086 RepID=A0ABP8A1L3_9MICO